MSPDNDPSHGDLLEPGLRHVFGLDLEPDIWIGRLRNYARESPLGRIGPYELLEIAGRGGQGLVYKARQPGTGRIVAIKRLTAGAFSTPEMRARFQREIETAASLRHPHIATAFGSELIDGQPILVMEWVEGIPVNQWAEGARGVDDSDQDFRGRVQAAVGQEPSGRRSIADVLRLMIKVCDAIQHAHQRGIIHRDLKPSNILVDAGDVPHVLDFGLAKLNTGDSDAAHITLTGAFLGTPAFASPEQVRGDQGEVDVRSDVYALGAVLYQMITGQTPLPVDGPVSRLLDAIQNVEPRNPSSVDPRADHELDAIVLKALSKEKERRYPSVESFAADLRRYLGGEAISAVAPSAAYRLRKLMLRHRMAFIALSAVLMTLSAATVVSISYYLQAAAARVEVQKRLEASDLANRRKDSLLQFVKDIFVQADPTAAAPADRTIRKALDLARSRFEENSGQYEAAIAAPLLETMAVVYLSLGLPADSAAMAQQSIEHYRSMGAEGEDGLAWALSRYGDALEQTGDLEGAEAALRESIALASRVHSYSPAHGQGAAASLIRVLEKRGDREGAVRLARERVEILEPHADQCKEAYAQALTAWALRVPCNPPYCEALPQIANALEASIRAWGPDSFSATNARFNYAAGLRIAGRPEEALLEMQRGLIVYEQTPGPDHPNTLAMRRRLAEIFLDLGCQKEATEIARSVIGIEESTATTDPLTHAKSLFLLGRARLADGDAAAAAEALSKAAAILAEKMPNTLVAVPTLLSLAHAECLSTQPDRGIERYESIILDVRSKSPNTALHADALMSYATAMIAMGRTETVHAFLLDAISILRGVSPAAPMKLSACLRALGEARLSAGRAAEAEAAFREALAHIENSLPPDSAQTADCRRGLGAALLALSRHAEAEAALLSAESSLSKFPPYHSDICSKTRKTLVALYEAWDNAEPGRGHKEKAAVWKTTAPVEQP
ncbi:MAG: hypothetical protein DCC65_08435 [Planctomycetota bacterium]|nr:MAG: hypothetical protein DCC65_08435 [Planctomycetota bacterium]